MKVLRFVCLWLLIDLAITGGLVAIARLSDRGLGPAELLLSFAASLIVALLVARRHPAKR